MNEDEQEFDRAMINIYETAKRECKYNATYFLRLISEHGGLETARRLLATNTPSEGFGTLFMCKRLDLTVEAHVIKPEFAALFTSEQVAIARERLKEYGFKFAHD